MKSGLLVKSRGINHIGQDGFLKSFKKLGYETLEFYYDDYLLHRNCFLLINMLVNGTSRVLLLANRKTVK
jgi:hypothetical protein